MKDAVVSVRIPSSLVQELKNLAKSNHYLDLSEQIREIIRQKLLQYSHEETRKSQETQEKQPLKESKKPKEEIIEQLQKLIEELKK